MTNAVEKLALKTVTSTISKINAHVTNTDKISLPKFCSLTNDILNVKHHNVIAPINNIKAHSPSTHRWKENLNLCFTIVIRNGNRFLWLWFYHSILVLKASDSRFGVTATSDLKSPIVDFRVADYNASDECNSNTSNRLSPKGKPADIQTVKNGVSAQVFHKSILHQQQK